MFLYKIPKGSSVAVNLVFCNRDPKYWLNNGKFCLKNWLSEENTFQMNPNFLAFSVGKRNCPGKNVGIRATQALLGNMILKYKFEFNNKSHVMIQDNAFVHKLEPQIGLKVFC